MPSAIPGKLGMIGVWEEIIRSEVSRSTQLVSWFRLLAFKIR
jgi:hypothetical protein